jgi:1-acyl-sn-glycerol-3-phosphate acyltransferase
MAVQAMKQPVLKTITDGVRSVLFNIAFFGSTVLLLVSSIPALFMTVRIQRAVSLAWFQTVYLCEKYVMGLDYVVIGLEHLPQAPYIVAAKHQSAWETMKIYRIFGDTSGIVAKKELMDIPLWGRYGRIMGLIPIDRSKGKEALSLMVDSARQAVDNGRNIVLFPQGTRVPVGVDKPYKFGAMKLYDALNVPLVPVAINAGVFWPKNSFWKKSGTITVEILPAIPAGLPAEDVSARMITAIETATNRLCNTALTQAA